MESNLFSRLLFFCLSLILILPACTGSLQAEADFFIRLNQVGFLPNDNKTAIVLSNRNLKDRKVEIKENRSKRTVLSLKIDNSIGSYGRFKNSYIIDFTQLKENGEYIIILEGRNSQPFNIRNNVYKGIAESLLDFFKVQRCGYTDPFLHDICHIADASSIIDGKRIINQPMDLTGGWHDAGDYVKFLNTTAFSTYMLLFAYDYDPIKFGFDLNKNNVPDVLEEAKIGLDWLLRCNYQNEKLVTQVQDLRDHDVGWRMPEDDPLAFDRPAYLGIGKNIIGIYSAALALGSKIWKEKILYDEYAEKCLTTAETFYKISNSAQNVDSSGSGMYIDNNFEGKLSLAAIELYNVTKKKEYLSDAKAYAEIAGADHWWSWGNINSLAHFRLAQYDLSFADYIKDNLERFRNTSENNIFGKGASLAWGTNNTLVGIALQNILWKKLTGESTYDTLAAIQKDFILGRNPWGISFIYGFGKNYSKYFHHQIAKTKGKLPGGFAAGPVTKEILKSYNIQYERKDNYSKFQTDDVFYRDDYADYVTNEPTITANATAIFVFGNL